MKPIAITTGRKSAGEICGAPSIIQLVTRPTVAGHRRAREMVKISETSPTPDTAIIK